MLDSEKKLLREKTFGNFELLWQFTKVFSMKNFFSPICKSFLPRKFPTIRCHGGGRK